VAAVAVLIAVCGAAYSAVAAPPSGDSGRGGSTLSSPPADTEPEGDRWVGGDGPLVGEQFPTLTGVGLDGRALSTNPRGRPLVVVVWDSRCRCGDLFSAANAVDLQRSDQVSVVGVNLDANLSKAAQTNLDSGLLFPSMSDRGGEVVRLTGPIPGGALLVVDPEGTVVADFRDGVDAGDLLSDLAGGVS